MAFSGLQVKLPTLGNLTQDFTSHALVAVRMLVGNTVSSRLSPHSVKDIQQGVSTHLVEKSIPTGKIVLLSPDSYW